VTESACFGTLRGRTHRRRNNWTQCWHGNGVADSLPSGSGNLDVQLGRVRLPLAHPLLTIVLNERALEGSFEASRVAKQSIQCRSIRNALPENLHLPSFGFDRIVSLLCCSRPLIPSPIAHNAFRLHCSALASPFSFPTKSLVAIKDMQLNSALFLLVPPEPNSQS
jgi:hypothetical protein